MKAILSYISLLMFTIAGPYATAEWNIRDPLLQELAELFAEPASVESLITEGRHIKQMIVGPGFYPVTKQDVLRARWMSRYSILYAVANEIAFNADLSLEAEHRLLSVILVYAPPVVGDAPEYVVNAFAAFANSKHARIRAKAAKGRVLILGKIPKPLCKNLLLI